MRHARVPALLTLNVAEAPAADTASYGDPRSAPGEGGSRAQFERALQLEIERLRVRIEELKHELEVLR